MEWLIRNLIDSRLAIYSRSFSVFQLVNGLHSKSIDDIRGLCLQVDAGIDQIPGDLPKNETIELFIAKKKQQLSASIDTIQILPLELHQLIFEYTSDYYSYTIRRLVIQAFKQIMLNIIVSEPYLTHYFYHLVRTRRTKKDRMPKSIKNIVRTYCVDEEHGLYDCVASTETNHCRLIANTTTRKVTNKSQQKILRCVPKSDHSNSSVGVCQCLEHLMGICALLNSTKSDLKRAHETGQYQYVLMYCVSLGYISLDEFARLLHLDSTNDALFMSRYAPVYQFMMLEIDKCWRNCDGDDSRYYCE